MILPDHYWMAVDKDGNHLNFEEGGGVCHAYYYPGDKPHPNAASDRFYGVTWILVKRVEEPVLDETE